MTTAVRLWVGIVALALVASVFVLRSKLESETLKAEAAIQAARSAKAALDRFMEKSAAVSKVDASSSAAEAKTRIVYRTITERVTQYVETNKPACSLPGSWRVQYNASIDADLHATQSASKTNASVGAAAASKSQP